MDIELSLLIKNRMYHEGISLYLSQKKGFTRLNIFENFNALIKENASNRAGLARRILLTDENANFDLSALAQLKQSQPSTKIVMVMYSPNDNFIRRCVEIGVEGLITENDSMQDLKTCIYTVDSGHICYPKNCLSQLFNQGRGQIDSSDKHIASIAQDKENTSTNRKRRFSDLVSHSEFLTSKQLKIIELLEQGLSNKEIARVLCIELSTVKNHVHRILDKLHLKNRCEAASWFRKQQMQHLSTPV